MKTKGSPILHNGKGRRISIYKLLVFHAIMGA